MRISEHCQDGETVVLCHIGRSRGTGLKAHDALAVFGCASCHDIIDGREKAILLDNELNTEILRALGRNAFDSIRKRQFNYDRGEKVRVIGIDPDSDRHGVAIYENGKLETLCCWSLMEIYDFLKDCEFKDTLFSIENVKVVSAAFNARDRKANKTSS